MGFMNEFITLVAGYEWNEWKTGDNIFFFNFYVDINLLVIYACGLINQIGKPAHNITIILQKYTYTNAKH